MAIATDTLPMYTGEARVFVFDYQDFPEVQAGETLSSPSVTVASGLSAGAATVTTADFYPGAGRRTVPAGKGVKVTITASTTGSKAVSCTVSTSGGASGLKIAGTIVVE